ncbi:hypothetical protein ACHAXR_002191 [Thalassiosira sp. AJA248-18]
MALAFFVDGRQQDCLATAFAAHDEYLSVLGFFVNGPKTKKCMTPENDFYSAPFCFMPKNKKEGFLVFTTQVPWLQDHLRDGRLVETEAERAHHAKAHDWQEREGRFKAPHLGSVEQFQRILSLRERDIFTFTSTGCYPTKEEISQSLEDTAVKVTCAAMGWKIPSDWRQIRKEIQSLPQGLPLLDLADWDQRKLKNSSNDEENANAQISCNDDGYCDMQEEKKDSTEEYQC